MHGETIKLPEYVLHIRLMMTPWRRNM